jgi:hypothetical protein
VVTLTWFETCWLARHLLGNKPSALQVLFGLHLVHFMCVHVCSCNTCTGGSHVAGSYVDVPNSYWQAVWMALF